MQKYYLPFLLAFLMLSCQQEKKEATPPPTPSVEHKEMSTAERIAQAHGIDQWNKVEIIKFSFNVDRDGQTFTRSWTWNPKSGAVHLKSEKDSLNYNHKSVDSTAIEADKAFINDKFWLLAPFQMVWDKTATLSSPSVEKAPVSQKEMNKITLTYPAQGGYTPGDAYDFYYDDDYRVREWNYRKGNAPTPTLSATWEDYINLNGLKIAQMHQRQEGQWKLYFTDVAVEWK